MPLQMFEADWLTSYGAKAIGANKIEQDAEYDSLTGRRAAFNFTDPDGIGQPRRIELDILSMALRHFVLASFVASPHLHPVY